MLLAGVVPLGAKYTVDPEEDITKYRWLKALLLLLTTVTSSAYCRMHLDAEFNSIMTYGEYAVTLITEEIAYLKLVTVVVIDGYEDEIA